MSDDNVKVTLNADGYDGTEPTRKCSHCGLIKPLREFGWRKMDDQNVRNQSWCKDCR